MFLEQLAKPKGVSQAAQWWGRHLRWTILMWRVQLNLLQNLVLKQIGRWLSGIPRRNCSIMASVHVMSWTGSGAEEGRSVVSCFWTLIAAIIVLVILVSQMGFVTDFLAQRLAIIGCHRELFARTKTMKSNNVVTTKKYNYTVWISLLSSWIRRILTIKIEYPSRLICSVSNLWVYNKYAKSPYKLAIWIPNRHILFRHDSCSGLNWAW